MNLGLHLKIGSDPEGFIYNVKTGEAVSGHDLLPGTKKEPYKVPGGAIQVDGVAAEINTDPANTVEEWLENHDKVITELLKLLGPSYEVRWQPIATFDPDYFKKLPAETQALGCDPDYNAWTRNQNPPPNATSQLLGDRVLRGAGGHIHVGWTSGQNIDGYFHKNQAFDLIRHLDKMVGLKLPTHDADAIRRQQYGRAGACRVKPYGVEYRTPSSTWVRNESSRRTAFFYTKFAALQFFMGKTLSLQDYENIKANLAG